MRDFQAAMLVCKRVAWGHPMISCKHLIYHSAHPNPGQLEGKSPSRLATMIDPKTDLGEYERCLQICGPQYPYIEPFAAKSELLKNLHYLNNFSPDCALQCPKHPLLAVSWWLTDLFSDHPLKVWNSRLVYTLEAYPRYAETSLGKHQAPEGEMQFLLATITTYFHHQGMLCLV